MIATDLPMKIKCVAILPEGSRMLVHQGMFFPGYWCDPDGNIWTQWNCRWPDSKYRLKALSRSGPKRDYLSVRLHLLGERYTASVSCVMAATFIGDRPAGMEVCHNDGNSLNNAASNLRYDTKKNNEADKIKHGRHQNGERNPSAKLTDSEAAEIRRLRATGLPLEVVAKRFRVRASTVSRIANGVRRKIT